MAAKRYIKHYVDAIVRVRDDGRMVPLSVCWPDGRTFHIDRVVDGPIGNAPRTAAARTLRYTVQIGRRRTHLFLECDNAHAVAAAARPLRWYVKVPEGVPLYKYFGA